MQLKRLFAVAAAVGLASAGTLLCVSALDFSDISQENSYTEPKIQNVSETENAETRELKTAVSYDKAGKDDVFYMMLNSIDYYDKISGTIYFPADDMNLVEEVQFQTSLSDCLAYSHCVQTYADNALEPNGEDSVVYDAEEYSSKSGVASLNIKDKTYVQSSYGDVVSLDEVCEIPDSERVTVEEDGKPGYYYRANPTNVPEASISIFPQEMAFGFLSNQQLWNIDKAEEFNGRTCYYISGTTSEEYGNKLNVSEFEFIVDADTGVLMQYTGYDENGEISDYMYTENINFDDKAESVQCFSDELISGFENTVY